ncbi:hypothetical protein GpartN1_g7248.t1 [Galdieria partita]|uniref:Mitotic spindle assembly checkpoint protein MAD1 n=1 Tax=Galdieria partita TaxID=83374 RepID=A0A9C7UUB2_9RHOD|nr:hypothetical protein GpartN1_g7248.t1 [Galdieria partita]
MNEETCTENILESLYQQLKTLQCPAVREALRATPRGKNVTTATVETVEDVAQLQAVAIALKNELVRTNEQMEYWKQLYEQNEEEHRDRRQQWENQLIQLTEQWQDAKTRYEESEWRLQETQKEWEEWKDKAIQEIEYWKQKEEKSNTDLTQLRKTLDEVQANRRRVEDTWKRQVENLQHQISKLENEKEQLITQVENLGDRWKLTADELEEERIWNKELVTQLEQANERYRQCCHNVTTTSPSVQEKIDQEKPSYSQNTSTTWLEETNKLLQRELNSVRKQMEILKWELTEAEEAKNSLEVLREQSNELLELVYAMTGVRDVEEAMRQLKELSYRRDAEQNVENERESALRDQMEEMKATIAALRDELQQNKYRCMELERQCERQNLIKRLLENERDGLKNILNQWDANMMNYQNDEDNQLSLEKMKLLQTQCSEMETILKQWEVELSEKDRLISSLKFQIEEWNKIPFIEGSPHSVAQSLRINLISSKRKQTELQQQKEELEEQLKMLTQEYEQSLSTVEEYKNRIQELQQVVNVQKGQLESHEEYETQIKVLQEAVQALEKHIGSGFFNPRYTKVVHLKGGPPKVVSNRYLREPSKHGTWIEQENSESTREQTSPTDEQSSSCATWNALSLPADKWKEKALDAEKRAQRTRQVAKTKINEFRETCYHLFGWKIHVVGAQYRLSSMYAESGNETLCFGRNELGGVELLETEYCYAIRNEIEQYCARWNSIPALLAAITLENFQKTTAFQQQAQG